MVTFLKWVKQKERKIMIRNKLIFFFNNLPYLRRILCDRQVPLSVALSQHFPRESAAGPRIEMEFMRNKTFNARPFIETCVASLDPQWENRRGSR